MKMGAASIFLGANIRFLINRHSVNNNELNDVMEVFKEKFTEEITHLEEAASVFMAMLALVEGDTGVIEGMMQPLALLIRRYDGTTMRDGVYEQMMMDRNLGVAGMRNPPQSTEAFATNQPINSSSTFSRNPTVTPIMHNNTATDTTSASTYLIKATGLFMGSLKNFSNKNITRLSSRSWSRFWTQLPT